MAHSKLKVLSLAKDGASNDLNSNTPTFINLVVVEEREEAGAMGEAAGGFVGFEFLGGAVVFIPPSALLHELVPNEDLLSAQALWVINCSSRVRGPLLAR